VIDSSSIVAIFLQEPDAREHALRIGEDDEPCISAANMLEVSMVLRGLKRMSADEAEQWLDQFIAKACVRVEPLTEAQSRLAREAHRRFGKGWGHPARLNYGDCFAYALAKALDAPLLFKGADFSHTDVTVAL